MSLEQHDDNCQGCRPALLDTSTNKPMPEDSPEMQAVLRVWGETTPAEREVFHRVTCLNSRDPADLAVMQSIATRMQAALNAS